jgi:hypothetical protein
MHAAGKQERAVSHENLDEDESVLHEKGSPKSYSLFHLD